jgi:hypothetical protein
MSSRKSKLTDDQIEAEVLAKLDDSSAWEVLPFVPPSKSPRPAWMLRTRHLEVAAKFHVLSVLHRLGIEANLVLAQPDNVDIAVLGKEGVAITIDVKTVVGTREWIIDEFSARKHHFIIVVEFAPSTERVSEHPHAYVVSSMALRKLVSRRKLTTIPFDLLNEELAALEAWQLIATEQAA